MEFVAESAQKTAKLGEKIILDLISKNKGKPIVVALTGNLGSGKTTFVQGMACVFGIKRVISPTFIIAKIYKISFAGYERFIHMDFYRMGDLETAKDDPIMNEFLENISDTRNIIVIEWADKISKLIPGDATWIDFDNLDQSKRRIKMV
ncbi:MAG: tRNA (adenosine(37)-N6)-threonylcarbamoyltransferase complex ATPase subunit type 1 TsaE [Patescibacteria group bacterium]|nr:tRNA (adenosine(37)-N6)-threonylcarbamoyltransferase complex ATPase subunit type 1 TsaE [Patescibacteria group bacterium]